MGPWSILKMFKVFVSHYQGRIQDFHLGAQKIMCAHAHRLRALEALGYFARVATTCHSTVVSSYFEFPKFPAIILKGWMANHEPDPYRNHGSHELTFSTLSVKKKRTANKGAATGWGLGARVPPPPPHTYTHTFPVSPRRPNKNHA